MPGKKKPVHKASW